MWIACCNCRKLLPSSALSCSSSWRSICCHSACHVHKSARRRLTSSDGSRAVMVIIDLSLPMEEAKHTFCLRICRPIWGLLFRLSRLLCDRACRSRAVSLCCLFLLGSLFGERLEFAHECQLCGRLAKLLVLSRSSQALCHIPLVQADLTIGSISLLEFSRIAITNPFTITTPGNAAST